MGLPTQPRSATELSFDEAELGPKMQACTERERRFVWAYLRLGGKYGIATSAALEAGYSQNTLTSKVSAHKLLHRERVIQALDEVGRKAFRNLLVPAVDAAARMIEDPKHPQHAQVVLSVLSRNGIVERSGMDVNVTGEVTVSHTEEAVAQLKAFKVLGVSREKLVEVFGHSGLSRYEGMLAQREQPKLIEHEDVSREAGKADGDA